MPARIPLAQDLVFELGEGRQQASHGAAPGCCQIKRFGQRHETDTEFSQFLQSPRIGAAA
jgi:hypothetical protein